MDTITVETMFLQESTEGDSILIGLDDHTVARIPKYAITNLDKNFEDIAKGQTIYFSIPKDIAHLTGVLNSYEPTTNIVKRRERNKWRKELAQQSNPDPYAQTRILQLLNTVETFEALLARKDEEIKTLSELVETLDYCLGTLHNSTDLEEKIKSLTDKLNKIRAKNGD